MRLCYIDESGTPQIPGNTSHYVLAGLSIPVHKWKPYNNQIEKIKSKYATFEIRKSNGKSELIKSKNNDKPYKYLFKEIYKFSQKNEGQATTECEIFHYPNVIRRVFEEWYSFKIGEDLNLTSAQLGRLANDFKITNDKSKTELGVLLKVCNILSHSINGSKNPQEIHQSAKYLMQIIKDNDPLHYERMKNYVDSFQIEHSLLVVAEYHHQILQVPLY